MLLYNYFIYNLLNYYRKTNYSNIYEIEISLRAASFISMSPQLNATRATQPIIRNARIFGQRH